MPDTFRTFANKVSSSKRNFFWMVNRKNSKTYTEMMSCLNEINEVGKGKPITADKIDRLIGLHERLGTITEQYTKTRKHAITIDGRERLGMAKRILELQKEENVSIFRDKKAVDEANRAGKNVGDLLNDTRLPRVDITGRNKETVGAALSSREKVEYKGQLGYFTDGKQVVKTIEELDSELKKPMSSKGREIIETSQEFFNDGYSMDDINELATNLIKIDKAQNPQGYNQVFEIFASKLPPRARQLLIQNPKSAIEVAEYCKGAKKYQDMLDVASKSGIKEGDELSRRNIATSRMASLLGVDSLVAKSERMILTDGKKQREGVFMTNAVGIDVNDKDKRHLIFGEELDYSTSEFQRQITSLQILDTICCQVDRHSGNIFYDVHDGKITGIQGIDNDMAFGTSTDVMKRHRELPSIRDISVADKALVERIAGLKREEFDRTFADVLSNEEIEAAWKRTQAIATYLSSNSVEKKANLGDWDRTSYDKIKGSGYSNSVKWGLDKIKKEKEDLIKESAAKLGLELPKSGRMERVEAPVRKEVTIEEIQQAPQHASVHSGPQKQPAVIEEMQTPQHAQIITPQFKDTSPTRKGVSIEELQGKSTEKKTPITSRPLPPTPVREKK